MFERFERESRAVVEDARDQALARSEAKVEAEHLLLALAKRSSDDVGRMLARVGLDHDRLQTALDEETRRTLELVGVGSGAPWLPRSTLPLAGQPRWGASAKAALVRTLVVAKGRGDRHIAPTHILIGVLRAGEGTVPRALVAAGVDPAELAAKAEVMLGSKA